ncbi:hypothetical protein MBLNU230_g7398t1 [Neophaeotheca triangularis]
MTTPRSNLPVPSNRAWQPTIASSSKQKPQLSPQPKMGWFGKNRSSKVPRPSSLPTPPSSTSTSPEPPTEFEHVGRREGDVLTFAGPKEITGKGGKPESSPPSSVREFEAPVTPKTEKVSFPTPEDEYVATEASNTDSTEQSTEHEQAHKQATGSAPENIEPSASAASPSIATRVSNTCVRNSCAHQLSSCGHMIYTEAPQGCASNCHKPVGVFNRGPNIKTRKGAYACAACISAILRAKHINNRKAFEAEIEKYQRATGGWLEHAEIGVQEQYRLKIWEAEVLSARVMLESVGIQCQELPVGSDPTTSNGFANKQLVVASVASCRPTRPLSSTGIPVEVYCKRSRLLLASERTRARLRAITPAGCRKF